MKTLALTTDSAKALLETSQNKTTRSLFEGPRFFMVMADYFTKRWLNLLKDKLRAEGRAEVRAEWAAWFERRMAAEANGEPFDEPPPSANSHG